MHDKGWRAMRMIIAALLGVLMATPGGAGAQGQTHKGYESPPFQVDLAEGPAELRSCGAHLVAEVTVAGSREDSIGEGFRVLAGYVFGGNATGQKIAMTVPVAQSQQGERRWTVRLMMPQAFSSATVPAPKGGSIRFVTVPPERQAALGFSGRRGDQELAVRAQELRLWVTAKGLTITAGPDYYFYDGPMTLPCMRRNEVAFTVM